MNSGLMDMQEQFYLSYSGPSSAAVAAMRHSRNHKAYHIFSPPFRVEVVLKLLFWIYPVYKKTTYNDQML